MYRPNARNNDRFHGRDVRTLDDRFVQEALHRVSFKNNPGRIDRNKDRRKVNIRSVRILRNQDDDMAGTSRPVGNAPPSRFVQPGEMTIIKKRHGNWRDKGTHSIHSGKRSYWYQVRVVEAGRFPREVVLQKFGEHLAPQVFYPICYESIGVDAVFYVESFQCAQMILSTTRKITIEGNSRPLAIRIKSSYPPMSTVNGHVKEKIKSAIARRYVAETKALDLTRFYRDPEFIDGLYVPLNRSSVLIESLNVMLEHIPDVVALNLSSNMLNRMDDAAPLFSKLKSLRILHLKDNKLGKLHLLQCFKDLEIEELVLEGNPMCQIYSDRGIFTRYAPGITGLQEVLFRLFYSELRKRFPKLIKLDGLELQPIVTFDLGDKQELPTPQPAFLCHPDGRAFVKAFLSQYFQLYDSDKRRDLVQAYHDNAKFSISASGYISGIFADAAKLGTYMNESRNLLRVPDVKRRLQRVHNGKTAICDYLADHLPRTEHDLASFVVDLPFFTGDLITLFVSGLFRDLAPNSQSSIRYFSRTFIIIPIGSGFCIVNDALLITFATAEQIESAFKTPPAAIEETSPVETPFASTSSQQSNVDIMSMVQAFSEQTGMNLEWSKRCLEEMQWDYQRAAQTFAELHKSGTIPAEAFIK